MRLVWHMVRTDVRRMWLPLMFWVFLLAAKNELGAFMSAGAGVDAVQFEALGFWVYALAGFGALVNFVLVALLVQDDALVGTRMFWATRPIAGGRLLAAKLIGAALMFGVLPVVVSLRWWIVCGYDAKEIARAVVAMLDCQIVVVLPALVLAAITENVNRFLAGALAIAVGIEAWTSVIIPWWEMAGGRRAQAMTGVITTQIGLVFLIGGAATIFVIAQQFLRRRLDRSSMALALATISIGAVMYFWSWDWSRMWSPMKSISPQAAAITVAVTGAEIGEQVAVNYHFGGLPENSVLAARADHVWKFPNGGEVVGRSGWSSTAWPGVAEWRALDLPHANENAMRDYVNAHPRRSSSAGDGLQLRTWLNSEDLTRLSAVPGDYTAELAIQLTQPARWLELPLRAGEHRQREGFSVRIVEVERRGDEVSLTFTDSRPMLKTYGTTWPSLTSIFVLSQFAQEMDLVRYALVNRERGDAIKLWPQSQRTMVGTQLVQRLTFIYHAPEDRTAMLATWLEGATLAVIRYNEIAAFEREMKVAQLVMKKEEHAR